jgi:hypothetical protein
MERETEPMADAPVEDGPHQIGSGCGGREAGEAQGSSEIMGFRGVGLRPRQSWAASAVAHDPISHGVESAPKANNGTIDELGNLAAASLTIKQEMIEAADDRRRKGRNLRSSPRTGKPFTWRREVVG